MKSTRTSPADAPPHVRPSPTDWRRLYEVAGRIAALTPWDWMTESDVFGVRDTECDHVGFVSIMGMLGEHFSVAVYRGPAGLAAFRELVAMGPFAPPETVLHVPHLQASFEDRDRLTPADRRVIKSLGLNFRGRDSWPMFRSYRPGYLPWEIDATEARFLAVVLDQVVDVAQRVRDSTLELDTDDDDRYLVRTPRSVTGGVVWSDERVAVTFPEPEPIPVYADPNALAMLKGCPVTRHVVQVTFDMVPFEIAEPGRRPYAPHMLLVVEAGSGMILAAELVAPEPTPARTMGQAPMHLCRALARHKIRPQRIEVRSERLARLFRYAMDLVAVPVEVVSSLSAIDEAVDALARFR